MEATVEGVDLGRVLAVAVAEALVVVWDKVEGMVQVVVMVEV
jgi:hypothetical protein